MNPESSLLRPERFESFRYEIEDEDTARRIEAGIPWHMLHMAESLDELYHAALEFSNVQYSGGFVNYEKLSDAMDAAHHALYEWKKNIVRLEGWSERFEEQS